MDFRDYDPAIARWTGIDPVTHHNMSPYMAFDGNPVFWADPSGADSASGNTLDVFGRDKFDTNGMYIPFSERGVGSFDEYLSQDGGGFGEVANYDEDGSTWYTLDKDSFTKIANEMGITQEGTISKFFEALMLEYMSKNIANYSFKPNNLPIANGSSPDGIASPVKINGKKVTVSMLSSLYDAKLIRSGGEVEYKDQAKNFIAYLKSLNAEIKSITYVTSHNVKVNNRIITEAGNSIQVRLIYAQYRWHKGNYQISFYHTQGTSRMYDIPNPVPVNINPNLLKKWSPFLNN